MSDNYAALPDEVVSTLAGRRFELVGFPPDEAQVLAIALQETRSLSASADALEVWPGSEPIEACDVVILNLTDDLNGSQWTDGSKLARNPKPLLLTGFQSEIHRQPVLENAAQDLLVRPFEPAEMLLRCYRLISRWGVRGDRPVAKWDARVLLADDDPNITNLLRSILQNHRMHCCVAADGAEALHSARRLMPDLIVLDVDMPRMTGFEVLAALRQDPGTRALPVILLTGNQTAADIAMGRELGANDYIIKPFSPSELVLRVKKLLKPPAATGAEKLPKVLVR